MTGDPVSPDWSGRPSSGLCPKTFPAVIPETTVSDPRLEDRGLFQKTVPAMALHGSSSLTYSVSGSDADCAEREIIRVFRRISSHLAVVLTSQQSSDTRFPMK